MEILFTILFIMILFYHILYRNLIKKRINGELKIKAWSDAYNHALRMNRERLLTNDQAKELSELDRETENKYNKEAPNEEGIFKLDLKKISKK
ncbi:MAG: hypothetical protein COU11_04425 [Candidatus Harrisonbacteria bacterium CG10_big_fil_rev_8_21_14_0_10_49_15]|uniref:Uncharacterized protein n=1 Tax=Candidatus Harrisonbacteria bacterium CG10_big_fil_rev_8_21_14_0_10_49_15 TaxID=1974587 RepID=A0A2H0ULR7_9BACT|nr:MAG: hypothetical protein COU11_04425 [Candidatus Harrisonbacteria bacterium CG10_big_fil_rev_8_21_14_0_10_49_15]